MVTVLLIYLINPEILSVENFKVFFHENKTQIFWGYIIIVLIRSIFFIPATVVLILGMALFQNHFWLLLILNMIGIIVGASIIYYAGKLFTAEDFFSSKHQKKLPVIKDKINDYGFWIVLLWSFFPLVPTDAVCYVSGATRMRYFKFISAVFVGEIILVSTYLYTGESLFKLLLP